MKFITPLAFTLLFAAGYRGEEKVVSDVLDLTKDSFKTTVDAEKLMLIEFFAPWCGHCKALAPEYEIAATNLKSEGIKLAKVDCTKETDLCQDQGVQGYPTLKVFKEGNVSDYEGERKADKIESYMKKQSLPAVSDVTSDSFDKFTKDDTVVVVGFFADKTSDEYKEFEKLAEKHRNTYLFGTVADAKLAKKEDVKLPNVVVYKKFDEGKNIYDGKLVSDDIEAFVKKSAIPLIDEVGPNNFNTYMEAKLPLAYIFVDKKEDREKFDKELKDLAKEHKGKVNFVFLDASKYARHAESINLKEKFPAFGIQQLEPNAKFPLDQTKELTSDAIKDFVKSYLAGDEKPSIKSAPIPEKNDESVTVVVADNYESIVNDKEKDVLIEFYAPWCGHCKKLEPIYKELGDLYKEKNNIVIAKMDSIDNDLPFGTKFEITGFPTIKLVKAKSNEIIDYNGDRTKEALAEFLKANASNDASYTLPKEAEAESDENKDEL